jgi:hypothetical protein
MVGGKNLVIPRDRRPPVAIAFVKAKSVLSMGVNGADALKLRAPWSTTTIGTCCPIIALTSLYQCANHHHQSFERNQNNCYTALNSGYRRFQGIVDSPAFQGLWTCPLAPRHVVKSIKSFDPPNFQKAYRYKLICATTRQVGRTKNGWCAITGLSEGQSPSPGMKWKCKKGVCRMVHDIMGIVETTMVYK